MCKSWRAEAFWPSTYWANYPSICPSITGVTAESLSKVKPAFAKDGTTHAGNASQISDGAAAVLLARRSVAQMHGLPILGKFVTAAVVGVPRRSLQP